MKPRIVYSTGAGRMCPECGRPIDACDCGQEGGARRALPKDPPAVPAGPQVRATKGLVARLRLETKGRGGKIVTVIDGLTLDAVPLEALARELKRACGTGGSAGDGTIELQGDRRERVRELLIPKGFRVKG